jgi:hypothetical protein
MPPEETKGLESASSAAVTPAPATTQAPEPQAPPAGTANVITPEVQALIDARAKEAVKAVRDEYEKKHIPAIKSERDRYKAELTKRQQAEYQQATAMMQSGDPEAMGQAARALAQQNAALMQESAMSEYRTKQKQWAEESVVKELGLEWNEEIEEIAGRTLVNGPDFAFDFQHDVAKLARQKEIDARQSTEKKLKELEDSLDAQAKTAVARALAAAGYTTPDPVRPGESRSIEPNENWRELSPGKLFDLGLEKRRQEAARRK